MKNVRFVFFGDSICLGQGVAVHKTWAVRISATLEATARAAGVRLVTANPSRNGDTTRIALERMAYDVQNEGVDVLLVQFGMNDANHWETDRGAPRVSAGSFAANLEEIIERGRIFGAKAILLNTNHPTTRDSAPMPPTAITYEASNQRYNDIIRSVCARAGEDVALNDLAKHFTARVGGDRAALRALVLEDGLHLSETGHDLYVEFLGPRLTAALGATLEKRP